MDARESLALSRARRRRGLTSDHYKRVDELFAAALELEDDDARARLLDASCANDPALRAEVETMLRMARASEDFLETPVFGDAAELLAEETLRIETPSRTTAPVDHGRFIPGDLVAGRYRIAGLLGRGGMSEVYRADDLRLGQPVALKFLAESLAQDGAALARFYREVSVARRISHRHVCRVYDIGEHAGMHFLSMEFIRGEELSSLLKRIGRLPQDKGIAVARQLCAGLAAIHDAGVLHRDLKPSNIMIDEHGDARITDFGIVALAQQGVRGRDAMIGTPAYMAPEQLTGGELTTRSDLYALGLVLFELFTGKRRTATPEAAAPELEPAVARVIERCLEDDPAHRPASALQVAAALPGGDPLAEALAAGETPSPQMVAAAPTRGSLRPAIATALLVWTIAALAFVTVTSERTRLHRVVPLERSPELLRETASRIARTAGYTDVRDTAWGFGTDDEYITHLRLREPAARWEPLRAANPAAIAFWYRQSPDPLSSWNRTNVTPTDPPLGRVGMVRVELDPRGGLLSFEGVPPQIDRATGAPPDWTLFFAAAGLDAARFRPVASEWTPPQHSDARAAWSGVHPLHPDVPLRVEAASYRGRVTYFDVIGPWRRPHRESAPDASQGFTAIMLLFYFGTLALGVLLAWKNLRAGRGDRRGAFRLALLTFAARMIAWAVFAHHAGTVAEVLAVVEAVQSALYWACTIGLLHLALEPFVRRRWPEWTIAWSRVLAGNVRDPLVGRDVLIGGAAAGAILIGGQLYGLIPPLLGEGQLRPTFGSPRLYDTGLLGARGFVSALVNQLSASFLFSFIVISVLLFFAMLTRNRRVAIGVSWLLFYVFVLLQSGTLDALDFVLAVITPTVFVVVLVRFGVLALVSTMFFIHFSVFYPLTTDFTAWYATSFVLQALLLLALALYGFRTSLAGQKMVRLFDE